MSLIYRESPVELTEVQELYRKIAGLISFNPERVFKRTNSTELRHKFIEALYANAAEPEVDKLLEEIERLEGLPKKLRPTDIRKIVEDASLIDVEYPDREDEVYRQIAEIMCFNGEIFGEDEELSPEFLEEIHAHKDSPKVIDLLENLDDYIEFTSLSSKQVTDMVYDAWAIMDSDIDSIHHIAMRIDSVYRDLLEMFECGTINARELIEEIRYASKNSLLEIDEASKLMELYNLVAKLHPIVEQIRERNNAVRVLAGLDAQIAAFPLAKSQ